MPSLLPFRTLRGKLIFFACLATLPAFVFVLYVATNERSAALQRVQNESLYVAESASREHAAQVYGAKCPRAFKFDHWCALNFDQGR